MSLTRASEAAQKKFKNIYNKYVSWREQWPTSSVNSFTTNYLYAAIEYHEIVRMLKELKDNHPLALEICKSLEDQPGYIDDLDTITKLWQELRVSYERIFTLQVNQYRQGAADLEKHIFQELKGCFNEELAQPLHRLFNEEARSCMEKKLQANQKTRQMSKISELVTSDASYPRKRH